MVRANNFSRWVNNTFDLLSYLAPMILSKDDIEVEERHRKSKGTTSGTAREMAKILAQGADRRGYITLMEKQPYLQNGEKIHLDEESPTATEDELSDALEQLRRDMINVSAGRFSDEEGQHDIYVGNKRDNVRISVKSSRDGYGSSSPFCS